MMMHVRNQDFPTLRFKTPIHSKIVYYIETGTGPVTYLRGGNHA